MWRDCFIHTFCKGGWGICCKVGAGVCPPARSVPNIAGITSPNQPVIRKQGCVQSNGRRTTHAGTLLASLRSVAVGEMSQLEIDITSVADSAPLGAAHGRAIKLQLWAVSAADGGAVEVEPADIELRLAGEPGPSLAYPGFEIVIETLASRDTLNGVEGGAMPRRRRRAGSTSTARCPGARRRRINRRRGSAR